MAERRSDRYSQSSSARRVSGQGSSRVTRRQARRRKRLKRLVIGTASVAILVIAAVAAIVLLGPAKIGLTNAAGNGSDIRSESKGGGAVAVAVYVEQDGSLKAVILLGRKTQGGVALGLPGSTLIRTSDGFQMLSDLVLKNKQEMLADSLDNALSTNIASTAVVEWKDLVSARLTGTDTGALTDSQEGAGSAAGAVLALAGKLSNTATRGEVEKVGIKGDRTALEDFVEQNRASIAAGTWAKEALPGKSVTGADFNYFEPDTATAKALLGTSDQASYTLAVQNGSGLIGAAEQAGNLLKPFGYTMVDYGNAKAFPNVVKTSIYAAADAMEEAARIKEILGIGVVQQDSSLASKHIRVVVGQDFSTRKSGSSQPQS